MVLCLTAIPPSGQISSSSAWTGETLGGKCITEWKFYKKYESVPISSMSG